MSIVSELTALQADITSARTTITNKGGTVTSGGGSSQLATDIATIPSGVTPTGTIDISENGTYDVTDKASAVVQVPPEGTIVIPYMTQLVGNNGCFYNATGLPSDLTLIAEKVTYTSSLFRFAPSVLKTIRLKFSDNATALNALTENAYITTIYFNFNTSKVSNWYRWSCPSVKYVYGQPLDFSSVNSASSLETACLSCNISYIRCVPNKLKYSWRLTNASSLTDESLVSVANCLNESVAYTLTLHSTIKTRCTTLLGNVTLDETETFHIFTADASGTTTLSDFITNTKGWTVA